MARLKGLSQGDFNQRSGLNPALEPFYHGVASGDPLEDRVIIWTRVTPGASVNPGDDVLVYWRVATDTGMANIVASGYTNTSDQRDYTVKVDVIGLNAYTCYYYDFEAFGKYSLRGRTRTAPSGDADGLRFAVMSCSNYEDGYFNSYRSVVERNDVDAVLHLGDYFYEYAASAGVDGRTHEPANEIITLSDYRTRYSHYRLDPDLRAIHQQFPFITVWDDHESANNAWKDGAENHDAGEGDWSVRKTSSKQVYFEWLPVREDPSDTTYRLYRTIRYGDLLNLYMLDTRLEGRDEQVGATSGALSDPQRTLLGTDQYSWLINEMTNSTAQWNIIGQQVMMAPLEAFGLPVNTDQWDGYPAERDRLFYDITTNNIQNVVVLTGDIHTSWANDLSTSGYDPNTGAGSIGVEYVVTSVTSGSSPINLGTSVIQGFNNHMKWIELSRKGYLILDVNKNRVQGDWWFLNTITSPDPSVTLGNAYYVNAGESWLNQAPQPSQRDYPDCMQAPDLPIPVFTTMNEQEQVVVIGAYPNPFSEEITIQYDVKVAGDVVLEVLDVSGKTVKRNVFAAQAGLNYIRINGQELSTGTYALVLKDANERITRKVIRL